MVTPTFGTLPDLGGTYDFKECKEFPCILTDPVNFPARLRIDLQGAQKYAEVTDQLWEHTFKGAYETTLVVSTQDASVGPLLEDATFTVTQITEGDLFDGTKNALTEISRQAPNEVPIYEMHLTAVDGSELDISGSVSNKLTVARDAGSQHFVIWRTNGVALSDRINEYDPDNGIGPSWEVAELGTFLVTAQGKPGWTTANAVGLKSDYDWNDSSSGFVAHISGTDWLSDLNSDTYEGIELVVREGIEGDAALAQQAIGSLSAYDDPTVASTMRVGLMPNDVTVGNRQWCSKNALWDFYIPAPYDDAELYLVSIDKNGNPSAEKIGSAIVDGRIQYSPRAGSTFPQQTKDNGKFTDRNRAISGESGAYAFYALVTDGVRDKILDIPSAKTDLVYNGMEQTAVEQVRGYVLSNEKATAPGSYIATATLQDGYKWSDGSKDPKSIPYEISKASLTAICQEETIVVGSQPKLGVTVVGFVNGETAETAAGYVAPTVALPGELEAGKSYELKPANGQAKNYTFTYVPGTLSVKAASAPATEERLKPGTYTVTANVWLNAADADSAGFPVLKGIAGADGGAYMTNATNPNGAEGGATGVPTSPVSDNATLVVADDGTLTLTVPIANPVFTMQKLGTNASLGGMSYTTKAGSYGNYQSRIDSITVTLPSAEDATYVLAGSAFHPTILASQYPTAITVPLRLTVGGLGDLPTTTVSDTVKTTDAAITAKGAVAASGSADAFTVPADLRALGGMTVELAVEDRTAADAAALQKAYASQIGSREVAAVYEVDLEVLNAAGQAVGEKTEGVGALRLTLPVGTLHAGRTARVVQLHKKASGQPVSEVITYDGLVVGGDGTVGFTVKGGKLSEFIVALEPVSAQNGTTSGTTGGNAATAGNGIDAGDAGGTAAAPGAAGTVQTTSDGRLAAGTYTVSANIWVNKETSGLPLQPHFTSAAFPPMNPVAGNATLRVDGNGRAYLTVPIVIQSRVMQVRSISGLPIVDYSSSGGGLTSITLDLGVLSATDTVVTRSCTASVHLGDLAASIIGGERDRTWAATFQMNFTGLPSSGGGEVPAAVQAMIDAAGADGRAADADAAAAAARASALGGLTKNLRPQRAYADDGSADPSAPAQQGSFPWAPVAGGVAVALIVGAAGYLLGSRRKRDTRRAG